MNFQELQIYTLGILDDPMGGYFNSNPLVLQKYLNNGLKEAQKLLVMSGNNFYLRCLTTQTVINQQDYILPDDFYELIRLDLILQGVPPNQIFNPLSPITVNQIDLVTNGSGQPCNYFLKQNRLVLWPTPNINLILRLFYQYEAAEMVNPSDVPDLPDAYHEFIGILAAIDGFIKDGRDIANLVLKRDYYEKMLKAETNERLKDASRGIVMTDSSYGAPIYF